MEVTVCACGTTVGSYFFGDEGGQTVTVNTEHHMAMLETYLWNESNLLQPNSVRCQQDGAGAHLAWISMAVLREMFPGTLISCFGSINFACLLAWSFGTKLHSLGLCQKQDLLDTSCQCWWFETANLGVISTAGVCWRTKSSWRCYIQTIMHKTNSQCKWKWIWLY